MGLIRPYHGSCSWLGNCAQSRFDAIVVISVLIISMLFKTTSKSNTHGQFTWSASILMILTFGFDVMIFFSRLTFLIVTMLVVAVVVVAVFVVDWTSGGRKSSSERPSHGSYCFEQSEKPDDASDELLPSSIIAGGLFCAYYLYLCRTKCPIVYFPTRYCDHSANRHHSSANLRSSPWFYFSYFFSASEQEMVSRSNLENFHFGVLTERGV